MAPEAQVAPRPRKMSVKSALSWLVMIAAAVALAFAANHHAHEIAETLRAVSVWPVLGAAALHTVTLALRSEAWRIGLKAVGGQVPTPTIHRANAIAFLVGTIQGELSLPARVAALRKAEPERAPTAAQTALVDAPLALVELACLFAFTALWEPWLIVGTIVIAIGLPFVARRAASSRSGSPWLGLIVATDPVALRRLVVVMVLVVGFSALRIWLILLAFDLPVDITSVAKVVAAVTLIGVLPLGLGTGPAATIASLSTGEAALTTEGIALTAGLAISATSVLGVVIYALAMAGWTARDAVRSRRSASAPGDG
ncbi:MAG: flippase-like domain-containing protein [Solirubrobacteraceae bacterium]|nr:flippase-like domain-containing protein [Solirubrobacteraceae bacterium]